MSMWIPVTTLPDKFPVIGLTRDKSMMICAGFETLQDRVYGYDAIGSAKMRLITHHQPAPEAM